MKTTRQVQREAKRLFRVCLVDGALDEARVRQVIQRIVQADRPGTLAALSRFQRLVRLDRAAHSATVVSAAPLPSEARAAIEANVARVYGPGVTTAFSDDPSLIGGVRITVGSDVYDGSVKAALGALEARL